jgi:hypothetical protein
MRLLFQMQFDGHDLESIKRQLNSIVVNVKVVSGVVFQKVGALCLAHGQRGVQRTDRSTAISFVYSNNHTVRVLCLLDPIQDQIL